MPNYQAVSQSTHTELRWKRYSSYHFAAKDAVAPLVLQELPKAAMALPLAFIAQEGQVGHYTPVALLGLNTGFNLFVAPDGRWIGGYTPAAYRGHPFGLASTAQGQRVLCVDADSGLVGPEGSDDAHGEDFVEPFFDEQGQPSASIKAVLNFLEQVQANRHATERLCALLAQEGLIEPWPITLKSGQAEQGGQGEQTEQTIQGLYRVSEAKFNALDAEALHRLHQAGALPVIYCQLLSMQHLPLLGKLADIHAKARAHVEAHANAPLDFEQLLHASEALATESGTTGARKGKKGKGKTNGHAGDDVDLNWSL